MADTATAHCPLILNSNGPAVVEWVSDGKSQSLGFQPPTKVHFHLYLDAVSKSAFFKFRIPVTLSPLLNTPTPLFVFVHPERIESVTQIENVTSNDISNHLLKGKQSTGCQLHLRFKLSRPADLVLPKTITGKAFHDVAMRAQAVLEKSIESQDMNSNAFANAAYLLTLLTRTSMFDVHVHLANLKEDSHARVAPAICELVSGHALSSNITSSDLVSLYGGKGAQVLDFSQIPSHTLDCTESPPAYNEVAPVATDAIATDAVEDYSVSTSKKRRRSTTPPEDRTLSEKHRHSVEDVFSKLFQGAMVAMESRLETRMQSWVEVRLKQQAEEIRNVENRMKDYLEERLQQQAEQIEKLADEQGHMQDLFYDEVQQVRNETDELCDVRIEDQMLSVKIECEEFVRDEMREAKRGIVSHFRTMANLFSDIDPELGDNG